MINQFKLLFIVLLSFSAFSYANSSTLLTEPHRSEQDKIRDKTSKPIDIIEFSGIKPEMHVLDLFAGAGYYSEILSHAVGPQGKVFLHNNKAYLSYVGQELQKRMSDGNLTNVVQYVHEADDLLLQDDVLDSIYFVMGYHDLHHITEGWDIDQDNLLKQLYKALKPGGTLLIIDHSAPIGTGTEYSQEKHRIAPEYVVKELKNYGFHFVKQTDVLANPKDNYELSPFDPEVYRKTDRFVLLFRK
ncbi:class I SAM-dependent methyltransferase [Thalassotalea psychrophila]|uniref:Class I SAM-dependent methyltransferase n=1 Tax=Thalassotalea psychrophila TaxID=3065647 RepID=A0ABY9TWN3_9GAMM|nr:class I SAM-dependent methyltransferase [Colwelliaceae bacterium SQ149]